MSQASDVEPSTDDDRPRLTYEALRGRGAEEADRLLAPFIAELAEMSAEERVRASRHGFNRWERWVWASRYPEEVPLVNGEYEWIAMGLG